jgi:hypothetical protein
MIAAVSASTSRATAAGSIIPWSFDATGTTW